MPSQTENYYDDAPADAGAASPEKPEAKASDEGGQTSILPKSFFSGEVKPGDKCDIEVVAVHEGDVEVKGCEKDDEHQEKPDDSEPPEPAAAPSEMSSMME